MQIQELWHQNLLCILLTPTPQFNEKINATLNMTDITLSVSRNNAHQISLGKGFIVYIHSIHGIYMTNDDYTAIKMFLEDMPNGGGGDGGSGGGGGGSGG